MNARLKDEFGGRVIRVRRHAKVMCHLMFGILGQPPSVNRKPNNDPGDLKKHPDKP